MIKDIENGICFQRSRDHGHPGFNAIRKSYGLPEFSSFDEMRTNWPSEVVDTFSNLYKTPADIDLFPAVISENPIRGGLIGKSLATILSDQFRRAMNGDRFWYEG